MAVTYDPTTNTDLDEIREMLRTKPPKEAWMASIRAASGKKSFPAHLQFENAGDSVYYTLGDLAATAAHEKATQYIYPERVKHVLYGPHGIAKGHKLSNDIQLCWRREMDGSLEGVPCITSGRHRLTAIILMLQELGIPWENQKIVVSTKVVNTDKEFAQLVFDNNDSRKMKIAEKRNHKLGAIGINTADEDSFYNDPQNSVRRARSAVIPAAFAAGCRFRAEEQGWSQHAQDTLYSYINSAVGHLFRLCKENREFLKALINGTAEDTKDLQKLRNSCVFAVENYKKGVEKGRELFPTRYDLHAGPRGISMVLAEYWGIEAPTWDH